MIQVPQVQRRQTVEALRLSARAHGTIMQIVLKDPYSCKIFRAPVHQPHCHTMPGHLSCTSDIEQQVAHVLLSSPVQKKSVVQNGANFNLRIISGKV